MIEVMKVRKGQYYHPSIPVGLEVELIFTFGLIFTTEAGLGVFTTDSLSLLLFCLPSDSDHLFHKIMNY